MMRSVSAPTDGDEDRRSHPRQPIELKVEYKRLNAFFADYTKNISRGGTFIQTNKPLPVGTEFVFRLYVPTLPDALAIKGVVVWVVAASDEISEVVEGEGPPGMGIRFVYHADDERRGIEAVVERLMIDSLGYSVYRRLMEHAHQSNE